MTVRLYDDPWMLSTETAVLDCAAAGEFFDIATEETVFFPGGGGQEPDPGTLNGLPVSLVFEKDGLVYHRVSAPFEKGTTVQLQTDGKKRRSDAEIHTGEHILSGLALKLFGAVNVGFHMGADFATADFAIPLDGSQLRALECEVNLAIRKNSPILISYPGEAELSALPLRKKPETNEPLRVVEVAGSDLCACCGTHVKNTGEVGLLKILFSEKLRGGTRVAFVCGGRAFDILADEHEALGEIARSFSAKPDAAPEQVKKQAAELAAANRKISALTAQLGRLTAENLRASAPEDPNGEKYVRAELELGAEALIPTAEALCEKGKCHVFLTAEGRYLLASSEDSVFDLKAQNDELKARGARGGGRGRLFSGRL